MITRSNVYLGIPDELFIITDNIIIVTIAEISSIPLLVYSSRICPKLMEGTMYSIITSVSNAGGLLGSMMGAIIIYLLDITSKDFDNLWIICVISNLFVLIPIVLL